MHIGQRLRKRREHVGLSQGERGRRIGVPQSTISYIERGVQADMTTVLVRRFAHALACTTDYLIGMYEDDEGHD